MLSSEIQKKYRQLKRSLAGMKKVIVAYSGGIDSTLLFRIGTDVLGENCIGVIGTSASLAANEMDEALAAARSFRGHIVELETREMENPDYIRNDDMRCFYCKHELFSRLVNFARDREINYILDGNNSDDLSDYRPGLNAAKELNVRSPFIENRIGKEDIRQLARFLGLPNWNKPAQPCLASRMAYGQKIDLQILTRIAEAEAFIRQQGFRIVRVRYRGDHVSVEVGPHELELLAQPQQQSRIGRRLNEIGFPNVVFDKEGYRSGKLNLSRTSG